MLTFQYTFEYDDDEILFATTVPYTYTRLWDFIRKVRGPGVTVETLCKSEGGIPVPLITIRG